MSIFCCYSNVLSTVEAVFQEPVGQGPVEHQQLPAGAATLPRPRSHGGLPRLQRRGAGQSCALEGDAAVPPRTTQRGASLTPWAGEQKTQLPSSGQLV